MRNFILTLSALAVLSAGLITPAVVHAHPGGHGTNPIGYPGHPVGPQKPQEPPHCNLHGDC
jgi:hypothetical protein